MVSPGKPFTLLSLSRCATLATTTAAAMDPLQQQQQQEMRNAPVSEDVPLLLRGDERTREAVANGTALYCPNPGSQVSVVAGGNLSTLGGEEFVGYEELWGISDVRLLLAFSVVNGSG